MVRQRILYSRLASEGQIQTTRYYLSAIGAERDVMHLPSNAGFVGHNRIKAYSTHHISLMIHIVLIDIKTRISHLCGMRTTLTLDDDVLELAARQAKLRGVSLGKTISDLLRRGLNAQTSAREVDGLVMFDLPKDSPAVTNEDVRRIEAEGA